MASSRSSPFFSFHPPVSHQRSGLIENISNPDSAKSNKGKVIRRAKGFLIASDKEN